MKKNIVALCCILIFTSAAGFAKNAADASTDYFDITTESPSVSEQETVSLNPEENGEALTFDMDALNVYSETDSLIKKGLNDNMNSILKYSQYLTEEEKQNLYDKYKKNPTAAGLLNGFLGFGIGFFNAGFPGLGILNLWQELASCFVVGCSCALLSASYNLIDSSVIIVGTIFFIGGWTGIIAGIFCDLLFRIEGAVIGPLKARQYNESLSSALGLGQDVKVSVAPVVDPVRNTYGLSLKVNF